MRRGRKAFSDSDYFNSEVGINELQGASYADTSTVTQVNDTDSSTTLLSANTDRKGLILFNNSTAIAYVKFGTTASATDFTIRLNPYGTYESNAPCYTGRIDCIWTADSTGQMQITELS